jgi:hypothetical protein
VKPDLVCRSPAGRRYLLKATYRVLTATVFLVPAFLISSCDDSKVPSEPADQAGVDGIDAPSFTTVGFGSKWHDPHIKGPKVRTFTNNFFLSEACQPSEKRFGSQDGAEIRLIFTGFGPTASEIGSFEDICDVGVYPAEQKIRGKLLTAVKELDFSYAGGGVGTPRMRIPIDCDAVVIGITEECATTDGIMEAYAYIDARGCNDGDANVGVVNAEDQKYCRVEYLGYYYDNWQQFVDAHSGGRVARKVLDVPAEALVDARTSVILGPEVPELVVAQVPGEVSAHYLIWMVDVR